MGTAYTFQNLHSVKTLKRPHSRRSTAVKGLKFVRFMSLCLCAIRPLVILILLSAKNFLKAKFCIFLTVHLRIIPVGDQLELLIDLHTGRPLTHSDYTRSCINTIVPLRMSTELLETCRGFNWTYYRRNCASSWSLTRISEGRFDYRYVWRRVRIDITGNGGERWWFRGIVKPRKEVLWMVDMVSLEASTLLPTAVFIYRSFPKTVSQLKICDFSGTTFRGFEVL